MIPILSVGPGVIRDTVRLAALEVPGVLRVGRGGPSLAGHARWLADQGPHPRGPRVRHRQGGRATAAGAGSPLPAGPERGCSRRGSPARDGARRRHGPGRRCRGLTARAPDGTGRARNARAAGAPAGDWRWRRSLKRSSASGRRMRFWNDISPPRQIPGSRRWRARSSPTCSRIGTRSTPGSPLPPRNIRSSSSPAWTAHCCVAPLARCYTRPQRRPGWRSPNGSSSLGPTQASRCEG